MAWTKLAKDTFIFGKKTLRNVYAFLVIEHGGRQESRDLFALIRISTFYSLRRFFEHLDIERLEARIAQWFISSATMAATSSTPFRR
jgi:hypothetical protein